MLVSTALEGWLPREPFLEKRIIVVDWLNKFVANEDSDKRKEESEL